MTNTLLSIHPARYHVGDRVRVACAWSHFDGWLGLVVTTSHARIWVRLDQDEDEDHRPVPFSPSEIEWAPS